MLLSLYASFRWAGKRYYALKICAFIILGSFLSTFYPVMGFWLYFTFPITFLSFPFYFWYGVVWPPPGFSEELLRRMFQPWWHVLYHVLYHGIRFLTVDITFAPSFEVRGDTIITHNVFDNYNNTLVIIFLFFILVNMIGAFLGYWLSKKITIKSLSGRWKALSGIAGISLIILGFTLFPMLLTERFLLPIIGTGTLMLQILLPDKLVEFWKKSDSTRVIIAVIAIAACLFWLSILINMVS